MKSIFKKPAIGLSLSGGAARGLAHIGVIKVLQEHAIPVSFVAGTSAGALMGALLAAGMSWESMADYAHRIRWKDLVRLTIPVLGFARHDKLKEIIETLIQEKRFEDLSLPFAAVAVDITTGEQVVLTEGSVAEAVRASCSIPGIFEPTVIGGRYLVDGGLLNNNPCDVVRAMGADIVIGVELNAGRHHVHPPKNILDVLYHSFQIIMRNSQNSAREADFLISPDLDGKSYYDLKPLDELVSLGEAAARPLIDKIKKKARL